MSLNLILPAAMLATKRSVFSFWPEHLLELNDLSWPEGS